MDASWKSAPLCSDSSDIVDKPLKMKEIKCQKGRQKVSEVSEGVRSVRTRQNALRALFLTYNRL
jgi:hypothetical protein